MGCELATTEGLVRFIVVSAYGDGKESLNIRNLGAGQFV